MPCRVWSVFTQGCIGNKIGVDKPICWAFQSETNPSLSPTLKVGKLCLPIFVRLHHWWLRPVILPGAQHMKCQVSPAVCVLWLGSLYIWWRIFQVLHMQAGQNIIISHIFEIFFLCIQVCVKKPQRLGQIQIAMFTEYTHRSPGNLCWYSSWFLAPPPKEKKELWRTVQE